IDMVRCMVTLFVRFHWPTMSHGRVRLKGGIPGHGSSEAFHWRAVAAWRGRQRARRASPVTSLPSSAPPLPLAFHPRRLGRGFPHHPAARGGAGSPTTGERTIPAPDRRKRSALAGQYGAAFQGEIAMDIIFAYTRAQAIADGVLIDVSNTAREAGIKFPT